VFSECLSGDWGGIPLIESTPRPWRSQHDLFEQREFSADGGSFGDLGVGSRGDAGQSICVCFAAELAATSQKLDGTPRVLRACIRRGHLDGGVQVESAKFADGVSPAAALLRVRGVGWIDPLWCGHAIVRAAATNGASYTHSHAAVVE